MPSPAFLIGHLREKYTNRIWGYPTQTLLHRGGGVLIKKILSTYP